MAINPGTYDGLLSLITLPDGKTYEIEDYYARQLAAGGLSFSVSKNAATTPAGVTWDDGGTTVTGTLPASANTKNIIYLVPQQNAAGKDIFAEYTTIEDPTGTYYWEKLGDTDISSVVWTPVIDDVLGADTTFTGSVTNGSVTVTPSTLAYTKGSGIATVTPSTDDFVTGVTPTSSDFVTGVTPTSSDFVTGITPATTTLATGTIRGVAGTTDITGVADTATVSQVTIDNASVTATNLPSDPAAVSTWSFAANQNSQGSDEYTLVISGANGAAIQRSQVTASKVSAGTSIDNVAIAAASPTTVATAAAAAGTTVVTGLTGGGTSVVTGVTPATASAVTGITPATASALTGVSTTTDSAVTDVSTTALNNVMLTTAAAGNVLTGITSATLANTAVTVTANNNDVVTVLTNDSTLVVA